MRKVRDGEKIPYTGVFRVEKNMRIVPAKKARKLKRQGRLRQAGRQ